MKCKQDKGTTTVTNFKKERKRDKEDKYLILDEYSPGVIFKYR